MTNPSGKPIDILRLLLIHCAQYRLLRTSRASISPRKPQNSPKNLFSGWWYDNCFNAKLTGEFLEDCGADQPEVTTAIHWYTFGVERLSQRFASMKIRPVGYAEAAARDVDPEGLFLYK